jgi:hypothetical protein
LSHAPLGKFSHPGIKSWLATSKPRYLKAASLFDAAPRLGFPLVAKFPKLTGVSKVADSQLL